MYNASIHWYVIIAVINIVFQPVAPKAFFNACYRSVAHYFLLLCTLPYFNTHDNIFSTTTASGVMHSNTLDFKFFKRNVYTFRTLIIVKTNNTQ